MTLARPLTVALALALGSPARAADATGGYAVVISKPTQADAAWAAVADALAEKHHGQVVTYDTDVSTASDRLQSLPPRFTCFVARPEEAGKDFVARVHTLTRQLDADPYTDTSWGIVTGYTPEAALRIARLREPLVVRNVAAGTEVALDMCEQGRWYSELERGRMVVKELGGRPHPADALADTTRALAEALASVRSLSPGRNA